jgi:hypothetical protein
MGRHVDGDEQVSHGDVSRRVVLAESLGSE